MDTATIVGLIASAIGILLGLVNTWIIFMVRSFKADVAELRVADASILEKMSAMSTLLAGQYVPRTEFKEDMREQTAQLTVAMDRMEMRVTAAVANAGATVRAN